VYPCTGHSVQLFDHLVVIALYYYMLWSDKLNKISRKRCKIEGKLVLITNIGSRI